METRIINRACKQKKLTGFLREAGEENAIFLGNEDIVRSIAAQAEKTREPGEKTEEMDTLYVIGEPGTSGAYAIARLYSREVEAFFGKRFADMICRKTEYACEEREKNSKAETEQLIHKLEKAGNLVYPIGDGGISGALWQFCTETGAGFEVEYFKVPQDQNVIEICEYFDLNPWELFSENAYLIIGSRDETASGLRDWSAQTGICAVRIGKVNQTKEKKIHYRTETDLFQRPGQDGLLLMLKEKLRSCL